MSIKLKKLLITVVVFAMFTTAAYAAQNFTVTGAVQGAGYNDCHYSTEMSYKSNYSNATLEVTSGPVYNRCVIYAYVTKHDDINYGTYFGIYTGTGTQSLKYRNTASSCYCKVGAMIQRGCYFNKANVAGSFTP